MPKLTTQEKLVRAQNAVKRWQRKLKLSLTKIEKYQSQAARLQKRLTDELTAKAKAKPAGKPSSRRFR